MTNEQFIKALMVQFAHREAAFHGGTDNMLAVLHVLRNRYRAGWHGANWTRILDEHRHVAAAEYAPQPVNLQDLNMKLVLQAVDDIFNGMAADKYTEGSLYYAELDNVTNEWFRENILQQPADHARVATVGNVSFFR